LGGAVRTDVLLAFPSAPAVTWFSVKAGGSNSWLKRRPVVRGRRSADTGQDLDGMNACRGARPESRMRTVMAGFGEAPVPGSSRAARPCAGGACRRVEGNSGFLRGTDAGGDVIGAGANQDWRWRAGSHTVPGLGGKISAQLVLCLPGILGLGEGVRGPGRITTLTAARPSRSPHHTRDPRSIRPELCRMRGVVVGKSGRDPVPLHPGPIFRASTKTAAR